MEARKAHVLDEPTLCSLLSLGVLCDTGCTTTLSSDKLTVNTLDKVVLKGYRSHTTSGTWMADLTDKTQTANAARLIEPINNVSPTGTIAKLVTPYHGCTRSASASSPKLLRIGSWTPRNHQKYILSIHQFWRRQRKETLVGPVPPCLYANASCRRQYTRAQRVNLSLFKSPATGVDKVVSRPTKSYESTTTSTSTLTTVPTWAISHDSLETESGHFDILVN